MGKSTMKLVKPKLQAQDVADRSDIYAYIRDTYSAVENKNSLKFLPSFILFVCCIIEEVYSKKTQHSSKINKRDEVMHHISQFFRIYCHEDLSEDEKLIVVNIIEDLHSSNRIKRISMVQKIVFTLGNWFLKSH
jgi:hypothetical protein